MSLKPYPRDSVTRKGPFLILTDSRGCPVQVPINTHLEQRLRDMEASSDQPERQAAARIRSALG